VSKQLPEVHPVFAPGSISVQPVFTLNLVMTRVHTLPAPVGSGCSAVVQQLFSSCSAVVQQLFSSCSAVVQQLFSSCSAVVQQLFSSRSAVGQQSVASRPPVAEWLAIDWFRPHKKGKGDYRSDLRHRDL